MPGSEERSAPSVVLARQPFIADTRHTERTLALTGEGPPFLPQKAARKVRAARPSVTDV